MRKLPTTTALAFLLLTAGIAGVVTAEPTSTDNRTTSVTTPDIDRNIDQGPNGTFEQQLTRRLAQFDLTDAQIRDIVTEAARLRSNGASWMVIRSSIVMHLYTFGVDAPFLYAESDDTSTDAHQYLHQKILRLDVTPTQARELHTMVHRMLASDASREEIIETVRRQLTIWNDEQDLGNQITDRSAPNPRHTLAVKRFVSEITIERINRDEIRKTITRMFVRVR